MSEDKEGVYFIASNGGTGDWIRKEGFITRLRIWLMKRKLPKAEGK